MAQITWNQLKDPDFKGSNALLLAAQEQGNTAIQQAGKVITDYQAANTKNNTDAIMNALQSAKTPEEYQVALANAQAIAGTKSNDFDQEKFRQAQLTQPGVIDAQQQQDWARKDRVPLAEAQRIIMSGGKPEDIAALNFQSDAARVAAADMYQRGTANMFAANKDVRETAAQAEVTTLANAKLAEEKRMALARGEGTGVRMEGGKQVIFNPASETSPTTTSAIGTYPGLSGSVEQQRTTAALADVNSPMMKELPKYQPAITSSATKYGVDPNLMIGIMAHESAMGTNVGKNPRNQNIVQMFPAAFSDSKVQGDLKDPAVAIEAMASYLNVLKKRFPSATDTQLAQAYHDGNISGKDQSDPTYGKRIIDSINVLKNGLPPSPANAASTISGTKDNSFDKQYNSSIGRLNAATDVVPLQTKVAQGLNDIKTQAGIKEDAGDTAPYEAKINKYLAKNKAGFWMQRLNSNVIRQADFANEVPGFASLPARARLAIMENIGAQNTKDTFKYWTNLSKDEMKSRISKMVSTEMERQAPGVAAKQQNLVENSIIELQSKLTPKGVSLNPKDPKDRMVLVTAALGGDTEAAKNYIKAFPNEDSKLLPPTPADAANTIAAGTTVGKPTVKAPVLPSTTVQRTTDNTPLGVRAIQGIGGVLGSTLGATPVAGTALRLLGGGSGDDSLARESANRLKYGSLYSYMKATNDPRLKN